MNIQAVMFIPVITYRLIKEREMRIRDPFPIEPVRPHGLITSLKTPLRFDLAGSSPVEEPEIVVSKEHYLIWNRDEQINTLFGLRTKIDNITEYNEKICIRIEAGPVKYLAEGTKPSMNIPKDKGPPALQRRLAGIRSIQIRHGSVQRPVGEF
jgi:hypothetical protein